MVETWRCFAYLVAGNPFRYGTGRSGRPTLWRYGDACNLYPHRDTDLLTVEWMDALMQREEMEYTLPTNAEHEADERQRLNSRRDDGEGELNRFCGVGDAPPFCHTVSAI